MHGMLSSNSNSKRSKSATHDKSERHWHNMKPESRKGHDGLKTKATRNFGTQTTGELLKNYNPVSFYYICPPV